MSIPVRSHRTRKCEQSGRTGAEYRWKHTDDKEPSTIKSNTDLSPVPQKKSKICKKVVLMNSWYLLGSLHISYLQIQ